jgi:hydroxyacylglutathione hydrolase
MDVKCFSSGPIATNAYVVECEGRAVIIDPAPGSAEAIRQAVGGHTVEKILITHSHWDHIGDCAELQRDYDVPVLVHPLDAANLENPGSDGLFQMTDIRGVKPTGYLADGDEIEVGSIHLRVMHTPGHGPGLCCFYCEEGDFLVSGDLVFRGSMGRVDLPTAEPEKMWGSLDRVAKLPLNTVIYPGHGPPTTVGEESWLSRAKEIYGGL